MTDKELRHMNRKGLLELLLQRTEENERLTAELAALKKQLGQRNIAVNNPVAAPVSALPVSAVQPVANVIPAAVKHTAPAAKALPSEEKTVAPTADAAPDTAAETVKQTYESILKANEAYESLRVKAKLEADDILNDAKAKAAEMIQKAKLEAEKVSVETRLKAEADYRKTQEQMNSQTLYMKQNLNRELSAAFAQMRKRNNH